ncbi:MAG TPA: sugar phosphate isomerase/epimerase [Gemmataceae bacterium]|nr:sugar phosphate isomerase/epimerase [Gemmataceae bacterium]
MARPVILFSGQWVDLTLEELAQKTAEWGYQGIELCCWGDHFEVQRALSEEGYCQAKLDMLSRLELSAHVLASHRVGQAVCDPIDSRHQEILPDYVWGDGQPEEVQQRAVEEMMATVRAAEKLGVGIVSGFTGSSLWSSVVGYPSPSAARVALGLQDFARKWNPILDVCRDCGVKFAFEVHPGQIAFDLYSAEMALDALNGREEFGFTFDPSHLYWQGIDPAEFLHRFPERIFHVHFKDAVITLNGRKGLLNSYLPSGNARRGWDFRSPGRGSIDWEAVIRALNAIGYEGPLSVEWKDAGMDREFGAEEACKFVRRLNFEPGPHVEDRAFREG